MSKFLQVVDINGKEWIINLEHISHISKAEVMTSKWIRSLEDCDVSYVEGLTIFMIRGGQNIHLVGKNAANFWDYCSIQAVQLSVVEKKQ